MNADFVVPFDKNKDTEQDLIKRILYSTIISRSKNKKPTVIAITGDSGEGKSWATLRLMELLANIQGYDYANYVDDTNIYTPIQYPEKISRLLGADKDGFAKTGLKKVNFAAVHEARTLVSSKNWQSFSNIAIGDVNAMSRSIKRIVFFLVSQFIKDIDKSIRNTLTYYIEAKRPKGRKTRLYWYVLWKDTRDIDNPKLRKRKLSGYLIYPDGRYVQFSPSYIEVNKPSKAVTDSFERQDTEAKMKLIKNKLDKLMNEIKKDMQIDDSTIKVDKFLDHMKKNPEQIKTFGTIRRKKWKLTKEARSMFDLTATELGMIEERMNNEMMQNE